MTKTLKEEREEQKKSLEELAKEADVPFKGVLLRLTAAGREFQKKYPGVQDIDWHWARWDYQVQEGKKYIESYK